MNRRVHLISDEEPGARPPALLSKPTYPRGGGAEYRHNADAGVKGPANDGPGKASDGGRSPELRRVKSPAEWLALIQPYVDKPLSQREIALELGISRSRLSELMRNLGLSRGVGQRRPNTCPHCGGAITVSTSIVKAGH